MLQPIKNFKLGDKILMPLFNDIYHGKDTYEKTVSATIYGIDKCGAYFYIGWKKGEERYKYANVRYHGSANHHTINYVNDEGEYSWAHTLSAKNLVLPYQASSPVSLKTSSLTMDISDWKSWAKTQSGHCPCDIPKAQCTYHK